MEREAFGMDIFFFFFKIMVESVGKKSRKGYEVLGFFFFFFFFFFFETWQHEVAVPRRGVEL
jgi:hypothetical protein